MKRFVLTMLAVSVLVAGGLSWFASQEPDGLERVAETLGFAEHVSRPALSVLPDYSVPGMSPFWSNAVAGIVGTLIAFGIGYLAARAVARRKM